MPKCPKCKSQNIVDEGLTYSANQQNSPKPIFKCKDCGEVFKIDENKPKNHPKN
jgi:transposase-like protein